MMETATTFLIVLAGFLLSVLLALVAEDLIFRGFFELVYVSRSPSVESEKNSGAFHIEPPAINKR
jgi:hypothetical protein